MTESRCGDDEAMPDIACRSQAPLQPLDPGLSPEVVAWVTELRKIWVAMGLSMNQFVSVARFNIDKSTISRYLNGKRVPPDPYFLERLLQIQEGKGKSITPDVHKHLTGLHMSALQTKHPHEYRVRLVNDALATATTSQQEAERYARDLEEQLADRNRQIQQLTYDSGRLRAAWDADYERLSQEIHEITEKLNLAWERAIQAEQRCQQLEELLEHLDTLSAGDEDSIGLYVDRDDAGAYFPLHDSDAVGRQLTTFRDKGLADQVSALAERAAAQVPVSDVRQVARLLTTLHTVGAIDQASRLARRAADEGRLDRVDLSRLEVRALATLLMTLHAVDADDLVRKLAADAISCAWRGDKRDVEDMLLALRTAGADYEATELYRDSPHFQLPWISHASRGRR